MYDSAEVQRLRVLLKAASDLYVEIEDKRRSSSLEINKERTQFFEKIALGGGAVIGATVSFVGSHPSRLHQPAILRSAMVALVVSVGGALYRNWIYPKYVLAVWDQSHFGALQGRERAKRDLFLAVDARSIQDGEPIDGKAWATKYMPTDLALGNEINNAKAKASRTFSRVRVAEWLTLLFAVSGLVLLIALAWKNF